MPAATLARLVLLEARRGGLPWLALGCLALGMALAAFLSQVAVTESLPLQAALVAAVLRAGAVFLIAAQVAGSTLREMNDKVLELTLALPVPRATQYLGRFAGFAACAAVLALAFAVPLAFWAPPAAAALWGLSLALECALVAAATLFFAMALGQLVPAIAAAGGSWVVDPAATDIGRILRLPGTINHKEGGRRPVRLHLLTQRFVLRRRVLLVEFSERDCRANWFLSQG